MSRIGYSLSFYSYLYWVNRRIWYFINHLKKEAQPSLYPVKRLRVSNDFSFYGVQTLFSRRQKQYEKLRHVSIALICYFPLRNEENRSYFSGKCFLKLITADLSQKDGVWYLHCLR